jgi:hypothetical protein
VPTYMGSGEGEGKGSPLIFKFNSRALLVCSSLAWPKQLPRPQQEGVGVGGFLSLPLTTCAQDLICTSISYLKVAC